MTELVLVSVGVLAVVASLLFGGLWLSDLWDFRRVERSNQRYRDRHGLDWASQVSAKDFLWIKDQYVLACSNRYCGFGCAEKRAKQDVTGVPTIRKISKETNNG